ncbi:MAG: CbiX/SirB N-terminal domain-containing protein [Pseudomonadales bacterium]|nr:CbiX/SirB N-terminal domain-containing protein [Pseudomonadales bacterium]
MSLLPESTSGQQEIPKKNGLVLIAHGSRSPLATKELIALSEKIKSNQNSYNHIEIAFLELTPPCLHESVEKLIGKDCVSIDIYPFFLNSGRHVGKDIPAQCAELIDRHPDCTFNLLEHFGANPKIADVVCSHIATLQKTAR